MDNDNKIEKNNIHNEVMLFLGDELNQIHKTGSSESYNLEKEYSKTKKNKSLFPFLVILICFVVVIGIAALMNHVISTHNDEISVSLDEFDDLNLKGLLNSVFKVQENYDNAVKNKSVIQGEMDTALAEAKSNYENELFVINSMKFKKNKEKEAKFAEAEANYQANVNDIHQKYDGKLSAADVEISEYKTQLESYDSAKVESAKEKDQAVDSERQLKQLEMKQMEAKYDQRISELENKIEDEREKNAAEMRKAIKEISALYQAEIDSLDPVLKDNKASGIIKTVDTKIEETAVVQNQNENSEEQNESAESAPAAQYVQTIQGEDFNALSYLSQYNIEDEKLTETFKEYQSIYDDFKYLDSKVAAIPQKNTIPTYVSANKKMVRQMGDVFAKQAVSDYEEKIELENEKAALAEEMNAVSAEKNVFMDGLLNSLKASTGVYKINSEDDIQVYIIDWARSLVDDEPDGRDAQINGTKPVKGKVIKSEDGIYRFVPALDKNGEPVPIPMDQIAVGNTVKLFETKK